MNLWRKHIVLFYYAWDNEVLHEVLEEEMTSKL